MASFTDTPQAYLAPYTPQVDVGAYASVLQYKQNKYDIGIQRVQSAVDSVAGLEVYRPIDKQYLESKMGELQNELKTVAGADFSSQSVVSQTMGMASKIWKDPNIKRAVQSTQNVKKLLADQQELKEKHPELYVAQNEWYDSKEMQRYISSQDLGDSYKGGTSATRYVDYQKPLNDMLKEVSPETTVEFSPDGTYQFKSTKQEIISPERLHSIVDGYISAHPEAMHQIGIDGSYNYKDYTPERFVQNINTYTANSIKNLQAINKQYQDFIDKNPNAIDFIADKKKSMADNVMAMNRIAANAENYRGLVANGNFEGAKMALFSDNLKNTFGATYQQNNIERDIKENYNATNTMRFGIERIKMNADLISQGLETDANGNIVGINPNSPNYSAWQMSMKSKGKNEKGEDIGKAGEADGPVSTTPQVIAETNKDGEFNTEELEKQVKELNTVITNGVSGYQDKFRGQYFERKQSEFAGLSNEQKMAKFNAYADEQEKLFVNGDPGLDPYYKQYKALIRPYEGKMNAMLDLKEKAQQHAVEQHPIPDDVSNFVTVLEDFKKSITPPPTTREVTVTNSGRFPTKRTETGIDYKVMQANAVREVEKYKGTPYYDRLKAMVDTKSKHPLASPNGFIDAYGKAMYPIQQTVDARHKAENEYIKNNGKNFNLQMYTFKGKTEELDYYKRQIINSLNENKGRALRNNSPYDMTKYETKDVEPIGIYKNAAGQDVYRFKLGQNEIDDVVSPQSEGTQVPNYDPNEWLVRSLEISGRTPAKGKGVLATYDGKLRYQIIKNPMVNGTYDVAVISNSGDPIQIELHQNDDPNSPLMQSTSPTYIMNAMEKLSNSNNPYTSKPYTRDELIYSLTHSKDEFKTYMDTKNKQ